MQKPSFDPGLTEKYSGNLRRTINNADGSFNVLRRGGSWRDIHPYLQLINMTLPRFLGVVFAAYIFVNTAFALLYFFLGRGQLMGDDAPTEWGRFLKDFYFSAHTLTTVGYGTIAPSGNAANLLAILEALAGLLGFAIATGLLFGRFSRPSAKISFSERMLVAPYQDRLSLQFRIVNLRSNVLMDLTANVLFMTVEGPPENRTRKFKQLALERERVYFLPLTWTIVHPIDENSPLWGITAQDLASMESEVLILIKGFDDTFSQSVNSRHSYRHDEIEWGAKFSPAFFIDEVGEIVLNVDQVGRFALLESATPSKLEA
jgi:inward rectifier potassium channel